MNREQGNELWTYDGSFWGFFTVVYFSFKEKLRPLDIITEAEAETQLFTSRYIETDVLLAQRMQQRLVNRLSSANYQFIESGFLTKIDHKALYLLDAIELALTQKTTLDEHLAHPSILPLINGQKKIFGEVHLLTGFTRFDVHETILYGCIGPKEYSIYFLADHFLTRYPTYTIMLYDETHCILGIFDQGKASFIETIEKPELFSMETHDQRKEQWQAFLKAVTIQERINLDCQRGHLPIRYRKFMTEFKETQPNVLASKPSLQIEH